MKNKVSHHQEWAPLSETRRTPKETSSQNFYNKKIYFLGELGALVAIIL